jgi:Tfp pilus assembly major pilin PilA
VKILGTVLPLIFVIGIVAAIALPAYQGYVKRAQAAEASR